MAATPEAIPEKPERKHSDNAGGVLVYGQVAVLVARRKAAMLQADELSVRAEKLAASLLEKYGNYTTPKASLGYFVVAKPEQLPDGSKRLTVESRDPSGQFIPTVFTDGRGFAAAIIEVDAENGIVYGYAGDDRVEVNVVNRAWNIVNFSPGDNPAETVVNPGIVDSFRVGPDAD
jgi:hypothetical protein